MPIARVTGNLLALAGIYATAGASEVAFWNEVALETIRAEAAPPPRAARALAILHASMYDSVNAIQPTHRAYAFGGPADPGANVEAAVARAAHDALVALYPSRAAMYDAHLAARLSLLPAGPARDAGEATGVESTLACLLGRANDGSAATPPPYTGSTTPGKWRPTAPAFAPGVLPAWGQVRTFAIPSGSWARPASPPALDTPAYRDAYEEVRQYGAATGSLRTADQTDIARFWADGAGTATPPGHWNRIARGVAATRGLPLHEEARVMALLNLGLADAAISCWEAKYTYELWRPISGIQLGDQDGNAGTTADPRWTPLLGTPSFPAYTSGHSTFSAAAATILGQAFGDATAFTDPGEAGTAPRSFASFSQAAAEAGMSRIYGGIHWQFDNTAGLQAGGQIGGYVFANYLSPVPEPFSLVSLAAGLTLLARRRRTG